MSWKAGLSRYLPALRFFACPKSPSSKGVMQWYTANYEELKILNPEFPLMIRTADNAMPAVTTELEWTMDDLVRFMIQTGRFRDENGTISHARVEAGKAYLKTDWELLTAERFRVAGFDPEKPGVSDEWKEDPSLGAGPLSTYRQLKESLDEQIGTVQNGPGDEWTRAENELLMCQRVDLWCAGPKEVERAVVHLYKLGRKLNEREVDFPNFIEEFMPGSDDLRS